MRSSALTIVMCLLFAVFSPQSEANEVYEGEQALEMMH